jgi:hypothetical protein
MFHPRRLCEKRSLYIASHKALTEKMKANRTSWEIRHRSKNFIMDDLGYDAPIWVKNKDIKFLFMNGRHIHTLSLLTLTVPRVSPALRTNVDYTFIFREPNMTNRKILYDNYAMFATFDDQVMDQCTNNYECLVIDNTSSSNSLTDQVFWYKAEPQSDFKMCNPVSGN